MATNTSQSAGSVSPHMWGEPEPANTSQDEAVAGICEMFPDAHPEAVGQCLKSNGGSVEATITDLLHILSGDPSGSSSVTESLGVMEDYAEGSEMSSTADTMQEDLDAQLAASLQSQELEEAQRGVRGRDGDIMSQMQGGAGSFDRAGPFGGMARSGYSQQAAIPLESYNQGEDSLTVAARKVGEWGSMLGSAAKRKMQEVTARCIPNRQRQVMEQDDIIMDEEEEEALSHPHLQGHTPLMTGDRIPQSEDNSQLVHRRRKPAIETDVAAMRRATAHGDDGL